MQSSGTVSTFGDRTVSDPHSGFFLPVSLLLVVQPNITCSNGIVGVEADAVYRVAEGETCSVETVT